MMDPHAITDVGDTGRSVNNRETIRNDEKRFVSTMSANDDSKRGDAAQARAQVQSILRDHPLGVGTWSWGETSKYSLRTRYLPQILRTTKLSWAVLLSTKLSYNFTRKPRWLLETLSSITTCPKNAWAWTIPRIIAGRVLLRAFDILSRRQIEIQTNQGWLVLFLLWVYWLELSLFLGQNLGSNRRRIWETISRRVSQILRLWSSLLWYSVCIWQWLVLCFYQNQDLYLPSTSTTRVVSAWFRMRGVCQITFLHDGWILE